jgi:hypothetical protein
MRYFTYERHQPEPAPPPCGRRCFVGHDEAKRYAIRLAREGKYRLPRTWWSGWCAGCRAIHACGDQGWMGVAVD